MTRSSLTLPLLTLLFPCAAPARADFVITGSDADKATWNAMVDGCTDVSASFKNLVDKIKNSTDKTVTIDLVRNKASVLVDSFDTNEVDLTDLEDLAAADPPKVFDRCQALAHFLAERWHKAENPGATFLTCHHVGVNAENSYRADRGYTDRIQFQLEPFKGGHTLSADGKQICHQWIDNGTKFLTYDAVPGERSEQGATASGGLTAPGTFVFTTDPTYPAQDVIQIPSYLGGGEYVLTGLQSQVVLDAGPPIPIGPFLYAEVRVLSIQGDAPPVPLGVPPFSTGPNHFEFEPSPEQLGIWNLSNGQLWISYHGLITNDLFPPSNPLRTYSSMTGTALPGSHDVVVHTAGAFLDGVGDPTWSHYPGTDCNGNGLQDIYDLALDDTLDDGTLCGLGADNGVLDSCDCADCNGNGVPDVLDIQNGTSRDCRGDGIPDECEIASGSAPDVNGNGVIDECEGACCLGTGSCAVMEGGDCAALGGVFQGDGTTCAGTSCTCIVVPFCFGDGSGAPCPCGNSDPGGDAGCANSTGAGGRLSASGSTSVSADDLVCAASNLLPNQPALLFAGNNAVNGGNGIPFGDGLRCAGGMVRRLGVRVPDPSGSALWGRGLALLGGWTAGDVRHLQAWYRNPTGSPCASGFNLTNGLTADFCP